MGQVLVERLVEEGLHERVRPSFFSASRAGRPAPFPWAQDREILPADDTDALAGMDVVLTCQGSAWTREAHPRLRATGWRGHWIDAASHLRMDPGAVIVLDPINRPAVERALDDGKRDLVGGNCTVSLMLMALGGLFKEGLVEWLSFATYQAASGAGAAAMGELVAQMGGVARLAGDGGPGGGTGAEASSLLGLDRRLADALADGRIGTERLGNLCAAGPIPWIDGATPDGRTREEWKSQAEANKILGADGGGGEIPIDGTCVRVGAMRSHAQSSLVRLTRDVPTARVEDVLRSHNEWVEVVPNERERTLRELHPVRTSGTLRVLAGRIRKTTLGGRFLNVFSCGDQLLWGAAEPLVRTLAMIIGRPGRPRPGRPRPDGPAPRPESRSSRRP